MLALFVVPYLAIEFFLNIESSDVLFAHVSQGTALGNDVLKYAALAIMGAITIMIALREALGLIDAAKVHLSARLISRKEAKLLTNKGELSVLYNTAPGGLSMSDGVVKITPSETKDR